MRQRGHVKISFIPCDIKTSVHVKFSHIQEEQCLLDIVAKNNTLQTHQRKKKNTPQADL